MLEIGPSPLLASFWVLKVRWGDVPVEQLCQPRGVCVPHRPIQDLIANDEHCSFWDIWQGSTAAGPAWD